MPGVGYTVLMQDNYVVHQTRGLRSPDELITFVNGYSFAELAIRGFTAFKQLRIVDPAETIDVEYVRQMAYRSVHYSQTCFNAPH